MAVVIPSRKKGGKPTVIETYQKPEITPKPLEEVAKPSFWEKNVKPAVKVTLDTLGSTISKIREKANKTLQGETWIAKELMPTEEKIKEREKMVEEKVPTKPLKAVAKALVAKPVPWVKPIQKMAMEEAGVKEVETPKEPKKPSETIPYRTTEKKAMPRPVRAAEQLSAGYLKGLTNEFLNPTVPAPKDIGDKVAKAFGEIGGTVASLATFNKAIGNLALSNANFSKYLLRHPKIGKYVFPYLQSIGAFSAYGQLNPDLGNDARERLKTFGQDVASGVFFHSLGGIKDIKLRVPTDFGVGYGLAKLAGDDNEDALIQGGVFAALGLALQAQRGIRWWTQKRADGVLVRSAKETLGIPPEQKTWTTYDLNLIRKQLAQKYHPDKLEAQGYDRTSPEYKKAEKQMEAINNAYEILKPKAIKKDKLTIPKFNKPKVEVTPVKPETPKVNIPPRTTEAKPENLPEALKKVIVAKPEIKTEAVKGIEAKPSQPAVVAKTAEKPLAEALKEVVAPKPKEELPKNINLEIELINMGYTPEEAKEIAKVAEGITAKEAPKETLKPEGPKVPAEVPVETPKIKHEIKTEAKPETAPEAKTITLDELKALAGKKIFKTGYRVDTTDGKPLRGSLKENVNQLIIERINPELIVKIKDYADHTEVFVKGNEVYTFWKREAAVPEAKPELKTETREVVKKLEEAVKPKLYNSLEEAREAQKKEGAVSIYEQPLSQGQWVIYKIYKGEPIPDELNSLVADMYKEGMLDIVEPGKGTKVDLTGMFLKTEETAGKPDIVYVKFDPEMMGTIENLDEVYGKGTVKALSEVKDWRKLQKGYGVETSLLKGDIIKSEEIPAVKVITKGKYKGETRKVPGVGIVEDIFDNGKAIVSTERGIQEIDVYRLGNSERYEDLTQDEKSIVDSLKEKRLRPVEKILKPEEVKPEEEVKGILKEFEPLVEEARKYGSAEEFIRGQGEILYRASPNLPTTGEFKRGTYFADSADKAIYYSQSHLQPGQAPEDIKINQFVLPKNKIFREPTTGNFITTDIVPVRTKSQLINIWKKANKKPQKQEVKPEVKPTPEKKPEIIEKLAKALKSKEEVGKGEMKLIKAYHGTPRELKEIGFGEGIRSNKFLGTYYKVKSGAIFFTPIKEVAEFFAKNRAEYLQDIGEKGIKPTVYERFLNIKNPIDLTTVEKANTSLLNAGIDLGKTKLAFYTAEEEPNDFETFAAMHYDSNEEALQDLWKLFDDTEVVKKLQKAGYDGAL